MAGPAFQLMDSTSDADGGYGTAPYGSGAYGGNEHEPYTLPPLQYPSDDLSTKRRKAHGAIVHRREGLIVGARKLASIGKWRVVLIAQNPEVADALQVFNEARIFWLLPTGEGGSKIPVFWTSEEFAPERLRGGYVSLDFMIEEIPSWQ